MKLIQLLTLTTLLCAPLTQAQSAQQDVFGEHYYQTNQIQSSLTESGDDYTFLWSATGAAMAISPSEALLSGWI